MVCGQATNVQENETHQIIWFVNPDRKTTLPFNGHEIKEGAFHQMIFAVLVNYRVKRKGSEKINKSLDFFFSRS